MDTGSNPVSSIEKCLKMLVFRHFFLLYIAINDLIIACLAWFPTESLPFPKLCIIIRHLIVNKFIELLSESQKESEQNSEEWREVMQYRYDNE